MKYAIETSHLTKNFGSKLAVNALNLQVPQASIFAFLGPNGAGKTTTIKLIMNILASTSGRAKVLGVNSTALGPAEFQQIGYVSENQELPEWMTIGQLLDFCQPMYPTWDQAFCADLVKQFELPLKDKIKNSSRGTKIKAALISSLAYRPKLLVLDEPFSGLDPLARQSFIDAILKLTENEHWTVFISSHDIDEVANLADWVGIIDQANLKICEETELLQSRFRKIDLALKAPATGLPQIPETWLGFQQQQRVVRFIDSHYQPDQTQAAIQNLYPIGTTMTVNQLSLKEIYLALAKQFKIAAV